MILADEIEKLCEPKGLGIIVKAQHYCMKWRGVKEPNTSMLVFGSLTPLHFIQ